MQAFTNGFKPFGGAHDQGENRAADKSYEVYLALYQAVSGTEEKQNVYKQLSRDFFDMIVDRGFEPVEDVAPRGLVARRPAVAFVDELGLTATLKETTAVSTPT